MPVVVSFANCNQLWHRPAHSSGCSDCECKTTQLLPVRLIASVFMQTTHGCGDLIFSSHTTFALVGMLTYTEYGAIFIIKVTLHAFST